MVTIKEPLKIQSFLKFDGITADMTFDDADTQSSPSSDQLGAKLTFGFVDSGFLQITSKFDIGMKGADDYLPPARHSVNIQLTKIKLVGQVTVQSQIRSIERKLQKKNTNLAQIRLRLKISEFSTGSALVDKIVMKLMKQLCEIEAVVDL